MQSTFTNKLKALMIVAYQFSANSATDKLKCFNEISKQAFVVDKNVFEYHVLLLFTLTHAENKVLLNKAEDELQRLANFIKKNRNNPLFADSGLPYTTMLTRFTQDAFNDLVKNKFVQIELESLNNEAFDLNAFLNITMPLILKEYTTAGMSNDDILEILGVKPNHAFTFLLTELNNLIAPPLTKDLLWQSLQSFFYVKGVHKNYSKSYNRCLVQDYFYHHELVKQFDHFKLINKKIPKAAVLTKSEKDKIAFVLRNSMPLAMREIDTITYLDINSLQIFYLERGLTLALYEAKPERQLPMQSFVGYSLLKNGYPVSYGGSWIFGECSLFGLNILEEFRGGESKYLMTQILRVYIQLYTISYYEIETFQFGNYEALETGAFWFYYKYGFRSKNSEVNKLALNEIEKIKANKNYKTSIATLKKLSVYNIALQLKTHTPLIREDLLKKINKLIANNYKGNSVKAIVDAKNYFKNNYPIKHVLNPIQEQIFEEVALWAYAHKIDDKERLQLLNKIIFTKSINSIAYNKLVLKVIELS